MAHRLQKLESDFLWDGLGDQPKFHLVKWDKICEPILSGGLGVKNLRSFNKSFLRKCLWRYGMDHESLEAGGGGEIW